MEKRILVKNEFPHWVVGVVLLATGVFIIGSLLANFSFGQANISNANVNITPSQPGIYSYGMGYEIGGSTYSLSTGGTVPGLIGGSVNAILYLWVRDNNSYDTENINVKARVIRTSGTGNYINTESGGNNNLAFFYQSNIETTSLPMDGPINCTLTSVSNSSAFFINDVGQWRCPIQVHYLSDPTLTGSSVNASINFGNNYWVFAYWLSDGVTSPVLSYSTVLSFEYPNVLGLTTNPSINFGMTDTVGTVTGIQAVNVENEGNQQLDIALEVNKQSHSTAWTCSGSGTPLVSDIHFAINTGDLNYNQMTPLTLNLANSGIQETAFNLPRALIRTTTMADVEKFRFATTQAVAPGSCTLSAIVVTALQGY